MLRSPEHLRHNAAHFRDAVRFGVGVAATGLVFFVAAAAWVSTCTGATVDTVACGAPQRALLAVGAPVILMLGAVRAFIRAYLAWRSNETWWAWQTVGWCLLTLVLLVITMSMPGLAGPHMFIR